MLENLKDETTVAATGFKLYSNRMTFLERLAKTDDFNLINIFKG